MTLGLFGRLTSQRSQITDRREARQERIGAAPRARQTPAIPRSRIVPPDLSGKSNQLVSGSLVPVIGSLEPVMRGSCRPRFSQSQDMASNWAPRLAPMKLPSRPRSGSDLLPSPGSGPDHRVVHRARRAEQGAGCCSLSVARSVRLADCTGGYGLRRGSGSRQRSQNSRQIHFGVRRIRRQCQRRAIAPSAAQVGGDDLAQSRMT